MSPMSKKFALTTKPLTPSRWSDFEAVFQSKGCSIARGCWCMYYRQSGAPLRPPRGKSLAEMNRESIRELVETRKFTGILAYEGKTPVGWLSFGPRQDFAKLAKSPVMKPVDEQPVWSVICFVVPSEHRRRGVACALLNGAIDYAARKGAKILEAYPVDKPHPSRDDSLWFGTKSMFDTAGFREVARRKPHRPVVRLFLRRS